MPIRIDYSPVKPDAALVDAITNLPGRKLVFTNGTVRHAEAVMNNLGVTSLFDGIFDIVHADYIPSPPRTLRPVPHPPSVNPNRAAFFEDIAHNLKVPHDMGMVTVLVVSPEIQDAAHLNQSSGGTVQDYIHHITDDLPDFLNGLRHQNA